MKIILETNRLILREFIIDDAVHFFQMNNDPDVIKYTGDAPFNSLKETETFLKNYSQYKKYNMGRWAVCLKPDLKFIGWCGLKYDPNEDIVEVGYRFYKKYWNHGYATESAKASIDYGFKHLNLEKIYAHAHIDNHASHKVIEKCNLTFIHEAIYDNMPAKLFCIHKEDLSK